MEYKGYEITTYYDENGESPNYWGDSEIFLVYDHRQFYVERKGFAPDDIFECFKNGAKLYYGFFILPVYAYIHSGIVLSVAKNGWPFNDRWDVSFKGFVLVKRIKGVAWTRTKALQLAQNLITIWNVYLSGEVYGYSTDVSSCYGFYGEDGYKEMIEEAKGEIDADIEEKRKKSGMQLLLQFT